MTRDEKIHKRIADTCRPFEIRLVELHKKFAESLAASADYHTHSHEDYIDLRRELEESALELFKTLNIEILGGLRNEIQMREYQLEYHA